MARGKAEDFQEERQRILEWLKEEIPEVGR